MEQPGNVLHFDFAVEVTKDNINKQELFKILKHLKPTWDSNDLTSEHLSGGFINFILKCNISSNPDDSVVFRIWSKQAAEQFGLNRPKEQALLHKLGEIGVAPQLYASFANGICYEYFEGEKPSIELCKTEEVAKAIAKNFAVVHGLRVDVFNPELECFDLINRTMEIYPSQQPDAEKNKSLQGGIPSKDEIAKEIKFLDEYLKGLRSPIVQCHGDAHLQNMMYDKITGRVILLDYELAHTGYQPEDLACFFLALSVDPCNPQEGFRMDHFPEEKYQRKFLRWYLEKWFEINGRNASDVSEKDVEKLFIQVNKYLLFLFFNIAMLFMKHSTVEDKKEFDEAIQGRDWTRMALKFFQSYFEKKEYYKSLNVPA